MIKRALDMKMPLVIVTVLGLFCSGQAQSEAKAVEGAQPINRVTIYRDRALVQRAMTVELAKGKSTVDFTGLTTRLDPKSLRAAVTGTGIELLGISWEKIVTNVIQNDKLSALEKERIRLEQEVKVHRDYLDLLNTRKSYIANYRNYTTSVISNQATEKVDDATTKAWNEAVAFLDKQEQNTTTEYQQTSLKIRALNKQLGVVHSNLRKFMNPEKRASITAHVSVKAAKAGKGDIRLSYVTSGAGWAPKYDARINPTDGALNLTYLASVSQSSGEDWAGVDLVLSTAQPHIGATPPELTPLWLSGYETGGRRGKGLVLTKSVTHAEAPAEEDAFDAGDAGPAPTPEARTAVENQGNAVTFKVREKATIPSDGRPYQVTVTELPFKGSISFETIPKERLFVFLKESSKNASDYPLLAGPVSIFRASGYIGTSKLNYTAPNSPIQLFAGIDEEIKIKRQLDKKRTETKFLFGGRRREIVAWDITMTNTKQEEATVKLFENIPVSQVEEVVVELLEKTTQGYDLDRKKGILTWDVKLKPGETKSIHLEYQVTKDE